MRTLSPRRLASLATAVALALSVAAAAAPLAVNAQTERDPLITASLEALGAVVAACADRDAADDDVENGVELGFRFCDDGVPPSGGGGAGVPVPAAYHPAESGDDHTGLPAPGTEEDVAAAQERDDIEPDEGSRAVTLDVDVSLPPGTKRVPAGGRPVMVLAHGFGETDARWEAATVQGGTETWHQSNASFASRGYVVVNYRARGHRANNEGGASGTAQLDSRRYEVNDLQYLVGLLADYDADRVAAGEEPVFRINPKKIAVNGGSYGGWLAWLALTDHKWKSPATGTPLKLRAIVPRFGPTDILESLIQGGHYFDRVPGKAAPFVAPVQPKQALSRSPIGVMKQSIVSGFVASANNHGADHVHLPQYVYDAYARLQEGEPYDGDDTLEPVVERFISDSSAYYQQAFWKRVANGLKVPIFSAAATTDPLFPAIETIRFYNKLKKLSPRYPIEMYFGDYQHVYSQNKPKEWADVCGEDRHVCTLDDYRDAEGKLRLARPPANLIHQGVNSRINRFLDHYLLGARKRPALNAVMSTTTCPANATEGLPADEPGLTYAAPTWRALAPNDVVLGWAGGGTTSVLAPDLHGLESDPVARSRNANVAKCYTTSDTEPGMNVVQYETEPLAKPFTLLGIPTLTLEYETAATDYWIAARVYDRQPDGGAMTLVTRGVCRVNLAAHEERTCEVFDLHGNGWRFEKGHTLVIEVTQADSPFLRRDNAISTIDFKSANIRLPVADPKRVSDPRA
ncbi:MAG TPA: CocE/NonD family hydrolase C-terminal non-catalytic domain-containing protein [Actinomycetota bacterium]|nr:CocE/NonD family hydrolase C-terminal non-catalytic domain-containing protein [Actinomycetota bacterium]